MIEIIPNLHPIFVHFTVSLLVFTGLLQLLIWLLKEKFNNPTIFAAQKWLIILGSASIIITVATGLQAYYSVGHDTPSHAAMTDHRNWAFTTATVFLLGAILYYLIPKSKQLLAGSLFVIAFLLLGITAFKGGELVYRYGLGVISLPVVEGEGHGHSSSNGDEDHSKIKDHPDDDH